MERELQDGVFSLDDASTGTCLWLRREIQDLTLSDVRARDYVDLADHTTNVDVHKKERLDSLKSELEKKVHFGRDLHVTYMPYSLFNAIFP